MGHIEQHTGAQHPAPRGGPLQQRTGGSAVSRRGKAGAASAGPGRDTAESTWTGKVTSFKDLGLLEPSTDSAVIAYAADIDPSVRRTRSSGRTYRIAVAWSATEREILVHRLEQELEARTQGGFRPSGSWVKTGSVKRRARKPASKRVGDVPVDSAGSHDQGQPTSSGGSAGRDDHASAAEPALARIAAGSLQYLPGPVRASVLRRAPEPDHFYGLSWRTGGHDPATVPQYIVQVLRMNAREAVVASGSRIGEDSHWHTAQYTYDLRAQTPDRGPALGRGGPRSPEMGPDGGAAGRLGR